MTFSPESGVDPTTLMYVVPDSRLATGGASVMSECQNIATGYASQAENLLLPDLGPSVVTGYPACQRNELPYALNGKLMAEFQQGSANVYDPQDSYYRGHYVQPGQSNIAPDPAATFIPTAEHMLILGYWVRCGPCSLPNQEEWAAMDFGIPWDFANKYIHRECSASGAHTEPEQSESHDGRLPSSHHPQGRESSWPNQEESGSPKDSIIYSCIEDKCDPKRVFKGKASCKRHLLRHTEPSYVFICKLCNGRFTHHRRDKYNEHLLRKHDNKKDPHAQKELNPRRSRHKACPFPQCHKGFVDDPESYIEHYLRHCEKGDIDSLPNDSGRGLDNRYLDGRHANYNMGTSGTSPRNQGSQGSATARSNNNNNNNNNNNQHERNQRGKRMNGLQQANPAYGSLERATLPDANNSGVGVHRDARFYPASEPADLPDIDLAPVEFYISEFGQQFDNDQASPASRQLRIMGETPHMGSWAHQGPATSSFL
ncbi:hypothetical protein VTN00DRAFT_4719 [Thermoascus crustaceus]|uniref:uncharacterized protein n=1 Tax=Thermoascus crustaceus TaxID=5088 RepID=UPI003742B751